MKPHNPSLRTPTLSSSGPHLIPILWTLSLYFGACIMHVVFSLRLSVFTSNLSQSPANSWCFFSFLLCALLPVYLHFPIIFPRAHCLGKDSVCCTLSTTGRCCCRHTSPSHKLTSLCQWSHACATSLEDILTLVTTGRQ